MDAGVDAVMDANMLPAGWTIQVSSSTGVPYFWNEQIGEGTFDHPVFGTLPDGWEMVLSSSTGGLYYAHYDGTTSWDFPESAGASAFPT